MVSWNHGSKAVYCREIKCFDKEEYARVDPETPEQKEKMLEGERGEGNEKEK